MNAARSWADMAGAGRRAQRGVAPTRAAGCSGRRRATQRSAAGEARLHMQRLRRLVKVQHPAIRLV